MAQHTHWKASFPSDYIGAQHLPEGKDVIVQIKDAGMEDVQNSNGGKEKKLVLYIEDPGIDGMPNKIILNKTNSERIEKVCGSAYMDEWVGQKIQLYGEMVTAFGKTGLALRVRDFAPTGGKQ